MLIGAPDHLNDVNAYPIGGLDAADLRDAHARSAAAFGEHRASALLATGASLDREGLVDLITG